ncbi:MAG: diaminopimelate decarboxylase [Candidatus Eiseniibacteriota bacterium]
MNAAGLQGVTSTGFRYVEGRLSASGVALEDVLARVGSAYVYDAARFDENALALTRAFPASGARVCYAVKANTNPSLLRRARTHGLGAEVSSAGELVLALEAGFDPAHLVLNGNGKTAAELDQAVAAGIGIVSVDSPAELARLDAIAERRGRVQRVSLRVNPDVDPHTHPYIATGLRESKFGMTPIEALSACARTREVPHVRVAGLHVHIGSQLLDLAPLTAALDEAIEILDAGRAAGAPLELLDLGGGFGIDYEGRGATFPVAAYGKLVADKIGARGLFALVEPGRYLVGDAGALVGRVLDVKRGPARTFVVLDIGMNDLLRPSLYDAFHRVLPLAEPARGREHITADVVGPICESGDTLARGRELPLLHPGDGVAILDAGAYGYTMSSNYNGRPRLPEVLVEDGGMRLVRRGETVADLARLAVDERL